MMSFSRLRKRRTPLNPPESLEWIMDSGGFTELHRNGQYSFTLNEYKNAVIMHHPTWFVNMDWMCEDVALAKTGKTVKEHLKLTTENHAELQDWAASNGIGFMGVIQGNSKQDYLTHIDMLKERGLICGYMGVGAIYKRGAEHKTFEILNAIREELPSVKIHLLGVKNRFVRYRLFKNNLAYSFDSMAWSYSASKRKSNQGGVCNFSNIICSQNYTFCSNCEQAFRWWMSRLPTETKQISLDGWKEVEA